MRLLKSSKPFFVGLFGLLRLIALRFHRDKGLELAAALSFSSLLAAVPLAAIALAAVSQIELFAPLRQAMQEELLTFLAPTVADEMSGHIARFLANARQLTLPSLLGLAVTASLLIWTIHNAIIRIWRGELRRNFLVRLMSYWAVIVIGPFFLGLSLLATAFLSDQALEIATWAGGGGGSRAGSEIIALPLAVLGLFLLYRLAPGRPVRASDALIGALVAAILIGISKLLFGFYVTRLTSYEAIYGALSLLPVLLLWLYFLWIMVLVGAEAAAGLPEWRRAISEGEAEE